MLRKLRMIQLILSQTVSRPIFQDNIYRFSLMCFRIYMPSLTSTLPFSKKTERHIWTSALFKQTTDPLIMAWSFPIVVFSTADDLFNLSIWRWFFRSIVLMSDAHMIPLCAKGKLFRIGILSSARFGFSQLTLKNTFSILHPNQMEDISWHAVAFWSEERKWHHFLPGWYSRLRCDIDLPLPERNQRSCIPQLLFSFHLKESLSVFWQKIAETRYGFMDFRSILVSDPIRITHITVLTAFAVSDTSVPWIP